MQILGWWVGEETGTRLGGFRRGVVNFADFQAPMAWIGLGFAFIQRLFITL
jgi:hypothetical protein